MITKKTYALQAFLSISNSGETYSAVPTNELARSTAVFQRRRRRSSGCHFQKAKKERELTGATLSGVVLLQHFRGSKVCEFDVHVIIQEDILRLQVPVNNVLPMQVLNGQDNLGGVESRAGLIKRRVLLDEIQQLAILGVIQDEI